MELIYNSKGEITLIAKNRHLEDEFKLMDDDKFEDGFAIANKEEYITRNTTIAEPFRASSPPQLHMDNFDQKVKRRPDTMMLSLTTNTSKLTLQAPTPIVATSTPLSELQIQKKYALLAGASYQYVHPDEVKKLFDRMPNELGGFELDKDLSSKKNSVYVDKNTGEVVISYRGTSTHNSEDIYDDAFILNPFLKEESTHRFKEADELYKTVASKYGKENI